MFVENALNELDAEYDMTWATFSVMEAKTGAIVASASNPSFNLNTLNNIQSYLNPLVSYSYEPGSTMKIFSFMAAIEKGIYDGSSTYQSGTVQVADALIKDFNNEGWGTITYDEGFSYSSNVAATYLALEMGGTYLQDFYSKLGFGIKTGITLPGEVNGSIKMKYQTEIATASFGQGITTTPIQNLQALTALANDGVVLKPYIVDKIVDGTTGKVTYQSQRTEVAKVASSDTITKMKSMMYDVVYSNKTDAKFYKPSNVTIIGKTGTAQIPNENGTGYLTGNTNYVRSFAGLFPYEDPEYIIYVSFKQFDGSIKTVATSVAKVVEEIAKYKNLVEENTTVDLSKIITLNNYINKKTDTVVDVLKEEKLSPVVIGDGTTVINQYPLANSSIVSTSKVFLLTDGNKYVMPDVIGWSANEIVTYCKLLGINYNLEGYGKVKEVNVEAGKEISLDKTLNIVLE